MVGLEVFTLINHEYICSIKNMILLDKDIGEVLKYLDILHTNYFLDSIVQEFKAAKKSLF